MYVIKPSNKKRSSRPSTIQPGTYTADAISITFYDKYADDEAFRIIYILTDEDGNQFDYSEVFFNDTSNVRTMQFVEYCDEAGISRLSNGLPDIVGHPERVVLKLRTSFKYPVIVERDFLPLPEDSTDELQDQ